MRAPIVPASSSNLHSCGRRARLQTDVYKRQRLDGDDGQGGGRDEERGERAGEHGLHGFPVRMETVVERCAWLNEVLSPYRTQW